MFELLIYLFAFNIVIQHEQPSQIHSNIAPTPTEKPIPSASPIPTELPKPKFQGTKHTGLASYYSRSGCIGCHPNFIMANGQPLDDSKHTVAFNRAPLGTMVKVTNVKTGSEVVAEVTDTGGFEKLKVPKIIDLSVATKNAIGCSDICQVEVEL